jgi:hypothetical protein
VPGLRFPVGHGPTLTRIESCLTVIRTITNVTAACIACTWPPSRIDEQPARRIITRLAAALGIRLTCQTEDDTHNKW